MGIGDEIMAAGRAEALAKQIGKKVCIVDRFGAPRWHEIWGGNPYITADLSKGTPMLDCGGVRPYIAKKTSLRWVWKSYRPQPATIVLTQEEERFGKEHAGLIVIEANIKPKASPAKQWPEQHWRRFFGLAKRLPLARLRENDPERYGVRLAATPTIRHAAAVLRYAEAYVGHEGALHHLAAAWRIPAVVIMGGYIGPEHTGYDISTHRYLTGGVKACGTRGQCQHCASAMQSITPEIVYESLLEVLSCRVE